MIEMVRIPRQQWEEVKLALETAESRLRYAGDLWHDQGNQTRAEADWLASDTCRVARTGMNYLLQGEAK